MKLNSVTKWTLGAGCVLVCGVAAVAQPERPDRPSIREPDRPGLPKPMTPGAARGQSVFVLAWTEDPGLHDPGMAVVENAGSADVIELGRDLPTSAGTGSAKGNLCIYVVDRRPDRMGGGISRLVSTDGGKAWGRPIAVRIKGRSGLFDGAVADPSVVQTDDGRLRLYFVAEERAAGPGRDIERPGELPERVELPGIPGGPARPYPGVPDKPGRTIPRAPEGPATAAGMRVMSAVSADGVNFDIEAGERVGGDGATAPEVVKVAGQWLMFLSRGDQVVLARSADGLTFEMDRSFVLRGGGSPGAVVLPDGRVRVYQSGGEGITSAVFEPSTGMFKAEVGVRLGAGFGDPAVCAKAGGGYIAVVTGALDGSPGR